MTAITIRTLAATTVAVALIGIVVSARSQSPSIQRPAAQSIGMPTLDQLRAERAARRDQAQELWGTWLRAPGSAGHEALAKISGLEGLRPTKENTLAVLTAMRTTGSPDDKAMLARIAGTLYRDLGDQGDKESQEEMRSYLSSVAKAEPEPKFWKAAATTYSRMGWFPDSMQIFARAKLVWGDRGYYGELAHAVVTAPKLEQVRILSELEAGDTKFGGQFNNFGREILANTLRSDDAVKLLHPDAAKATLAWFRKKEPAFAPEPEKMGVSSLAAYSDWVTAMVALTANATGEAPRSALSRLINPQADPRKLIAIVVGPESPALAPGALDKNTLASLDKNIAAYGERFKSNRNVQEFVTAARGQLANQK